MGAVAVPCVLSAPCGELLSCVKNIFTTGDTEVTGGSFFRTLMLAVMAIVLAAS